MKLPASPGFTRRRVNQILSDHRKETDVRQVEGSSGMQGFRCGKRANSAFARPDLANEMKNRR